MSVDVEQFILAPDYITPLGQVIGIMAGCVAVLGSVGEIVKLENAGLSCMMPMWVGDEDGEYMWQMWRGEAQRAQRILGGRR